MKNSLINFLFEASALKRLKRTGWQILGDNRESIAEHTFMVCVVSFVLASQLNADIEKALIIALFHDFEEARTGDVYKLADFYTEIDKTKARHDAFSNLPKSDKISKLLEEYEQRASLEARIVRDADTLALCIELKQLIEKGNVNAQEWLVANLDSLKLNQAKIIGQEIIKGNTQSWWQKERKKLHKMLTG